MLTNLESKIITVTIDGQTVKVKQGVTVLEASREAGVYIPTLCYHPSLEPYGGCRLCIVEIEGLRGFPTSCTTPATEGMVVTTKSPKLQELRRGIFELIIAEHPMQCITCAKNLRCELQEVASRIGLEKISLPSTYKALPVLQDSPFFDRDYNLCILCGRCVRVCQEIRGAGAIAFTYRGSQALVGTAFNKSLQDANCKFCGACVDICPTGALLERSGKWQGIPDRSITTTCPYCGVGCQLNLQIKDGEILRVEPVMENAVNQGQACVKGRFGIAEFVHHPERLKTPLIRKNGNLVEATWDEALDLVAAKLANYKGEQFAFIASAKCTNEENYLAQKFTRAVMGTNNIDHCARL
jgi:predicted molibdopterin-dependent oxidoreductase YjgC